MSANVLPEIDYSKLEELRKRLPDLSDIELSAPKMDDVSKRAEEVGKRAEEAVDRLLGRKRSPTWPRIVIALGLIAVVGAVAAWLTWGRRPGWGAPDLDDAELGTTGTAGGGMPYGGTTTPAGASFDLGTGSTSDLGDGGLSSSSDSTWNTREADGEGGGLTAAEASLTSNRESDDRG